MDGRHTFVVNDKISPSIIKRKVNGPVWKFVSDRETSRDWPISGCDIVEFICLAICY